MLRRIQVVPLAAESLGVRSMCTYVETKDVKILLDGGVSLCPLRHGLPPHPREFEAIIGARQRIAESAEKADIITISHYHYDHVTPAFEDWLCNWTQAIGTAQQIYSGKKVFVKNPRDHINSSQRERAWLFRKTSGKHVSTLETADGKTFTCQDTQITFSDPVPHGPENSELGWVLMTTIRCQDESFLFASDVQGPMRSLTLRIILEEKPHLLMLGGPPLYLTGFKVTEQQNEDAMDNLLKIAENIPHVILDHHILRDEDWRNKCGYIIDSAHESGNILQTAAEYIGVGNTPLEATRNLLYDKDPPSRDFKIWMHLDEDKKKHTKPPLQGSSS